MESGSEQIMYLSGWSDHQIQLHGNADLFAVCSCNNTFGREVGVFFFNRFGILVVLNTKTLAAGLSGLARVLSLFNLFVVLLGVLGMLVRITRGAKKRLCKVDISL